MTFHQFFMNCSLNESNDAYRKRLKNLAFGSGGLIFSRDGASFLCIGDGEFRVPDEYSEHEKHNLMNAFFKNSQFDDLAKKIFCQRTGTRKTDKIRAITDKVLADDSLPIAQARQIHVCILLAILLKLIDSLDRVNLSKFACLDFVVNSCK